MLQVCSVYSQLLQLFSRGQFAIISSVPKLVWDNDPHCRPRSDIKKRHMGIRLGKGERFAIGCHSRSQFLHAMISRCGLSGSAGTFVERPNSPLNPLPGGTSVRVADAISTANHEIKQWSRAYHKRIRQNSLILMTKCSPLTLDPALRLFVTVRFSRFVNTIFTNEAVPSCLEDRCHA
jgi:hypothetical protein